MKLQLNFTDKHPNKVYHKTVRFDSPVRQKQKSDSSGLGQNSMESHVHGREWELCQNLAKIGREIDSSIKNACPP